MAHGLLALLALDGEAASGQKLTEMAQTKNASAMPMIITTRESARPSRSARPPRKKRPLVLPMPIAAIRRTAEDCGMP